MSSTHEKTHVAKPPAATRAEGGAFFRKAGEGGFFGARESGSFFPAAVQAKLEVSHPDDPQEKEADAVADNVMRMAEPAGDAGGGEERKDEAVQRSAQVARVAESSAPGRLAGSAFLSRMAGAGGFASHGRNEEDGGSTEVQAKAESDRVASFIARSARGPPGGEARSATQAEASSTGSSHRSFEASLASSKGSGNPLPTDTRQSMESRFGADFSGVRVHTGSHAEALSAGISAQAFTHGNDIYFNSGRYDPGSATGGRLLAHELTHTIQQGASPAVAARSPSRPGRGAAGSIARSVQRRADRSLQRTEAGSQRQAAVELAKAEQGKVNANAQGPDGKRQGWERLVEYFKTTFGPDRILPEGASQQPDTVNEAQIKTKSMATGRVMGEGGKTPLENGQRDAMPSWCGIFAFWALNKGGIPLRKWRLGQSVIPPEAAYPPAYQPQPGDIAYREEFSHYALVASSDGSTVTTVNGNTAGDDNIGGQIQVQSHPREHWFAFFDPTLMMEGSLRSPDARDLPGAAQTRSLKELRKKLFNVNRKAEAQPAQAAAGTRVAAQPEAQQEEKPETEEKLQAKPDEAQRAKLSAAADGSSGDAAGAGAGGEAGAGGGVGAGGGAAGDDVEEPAAEGAGAGGFAVHRSAVPGDAGHFQCGKAHATAARAPLPHAGAETGTAASPADRREDTSARAGDAAHRQPLSLHNRGPPRAPPLVQSKVDRRIQRGWLGDAWDAVSSAVSEAAAWVEKGLDAAKEWLLDKVRDFVSEIPGYKVLCLLLGEDPITGAPAPMTGANLLEAGLDILPGGHMCRFLLRRLGLFEDVALWLEGRVQDVQSLASGIGGRFDAFWNGISLEDAGDPQGVLDRVADLLRGTITDIVGFVERSAETFLDMIKTVMIRELAAFVRARVPNLYPLLTVALGFDPETMQPVARNGTNILNAFLEVSEDGREQRKQMLESGTFQKIVGWVDRGIAVFSAAYAMLKAAIAGIWDFVTVENLFSPVETFGRIYATFSAPVILVGKFLIDAGIEILKVVKDAILGKLSAYARTVRGYPLLCVIIGKDPFTGAKVDRSVHNVVKGFMSLMEGGEQQYEQLKESGAIDRIVAKVEAAVARLNMTPQAVVQLFIDLWNSFSIRDLARPQEAFRRIVDTFGAPILRLIRFVIEIVMIVVEAVLILMNFPFDIVSNIIAKARQAFELIKKDPAGFFMNLLRAIKQGFIQFFDNILKHLINGVVGWLMGELRDAGVPLLSDFSLKGVISWVLEVLGISMEKIWKKLEEHPKIGPAKVAKIRGMIDKLEGIWTFIKDVQERGMAAIWDKIQEQLSNLWDTVLDAVKNWIMEKIITAVVTKLLSLLDPTGIMAVVNSCIAIYKAVQSFIKYITEMLKVVNSFVEGVVEIAEGNIARAADFLEGAMDKAMPIVIGFLANQVGLGGVGKRIAEIIGKVQAMVDKALTWLVNKAVDTGMALIDKAVALGKKAVAAVKNWLGLEKTFKADDGKQHKLYLGGSESNPVLMVQSNPEAFEAFLGKVTIDPKDPKKGEKETAKGKAVELAKKIDARKSEKLKEGETKESKIQAVQDLIDQLAVHAAHLFGDLGDVPEPNPDFIPQGAGFGKVMKAVHLNKKQKLKGSTPASTGNSQYPILDQRRVIGNPDEPYYVRGHLLNQDLGGVGEWRNLTPLSRSGNSKHEGMVESLVKAGFQTGAVMGYEVTADYGGYGKNAAKIPATDPDAATKLAIIAAEKDVPTGLKCEAYTMEKQGDAYVKKDAVVSQVTVPNLIEQDASDYVLSTSATVKSFADLKKEIIALLGTAAPGTWAAFKNKGKVYTSSVEALKPEERGELEALFTAHEREIAKKAELKRISELDPDKGGIQTWKAFIGLPVQRVFFDITDDAHFKEVQDAFASEQESLKTKVLAAATAEIPSIKGEMLWNDFKKTRKLTFKGEGGGGDDPRIAKVQTAFEEHQKKLKKAAKAAKKAAAAGDAEEA